MPGPSPLPVRIQTLPRHLRGPTLAFWPFHVIRDYAAGLAEAGHRLVPELPSLLARAERLEQAVGPIDMCFGHNDLLAAKYQIAHPNAYAAALLAPPP